MLTPSVSHQDTQGYANWSVGSDWVVMSASLP